MGSEFTNEGLTISVMSEDNSASKRALMFSSEISALYTETGVVYEPSAIFLIISFISGEARHKLYVVL